MRKLPRADSSQLANGRSSFTDFLRRQKAGVSAVEFALVSPVLLIILAGTVDIGGSLKAKFELSSAVSAGSNYALLNGDKVNSSGGSALAGNIATVVTSGLSGNGGGIQVVINNGATLAYNATTSTATQSGTAANADLCYCPGSSGAVAWSTPVACGSICSAGGIAGKFVTITASKPYTPLFGGFGIVSNGNITIQAVVKPQ
ncbi:TadE/TadG family type IV pilus assembly protein [Mesorhizobium sp. NZP2077]|uniref:TadE/TadG family type IV pilus assembly protein n=1 Tax=Mesorhizobium sp. NZP2077 TaxID=2483404 RepID=UPI001557C3AA|nr:TadE/TadG family type IV pilus assembly protein [Mesorhizobium sp. NZP2077]QKC84519.1 pilus assembly protein [Mesorhizobium sp. NZP2077]QKD18084.1 pilus assembly protein [Mesorhizobium sp. NZP2077]